MKIRNLFFAVMYAGMTAAGFGSFSRMRGWGAVLMLVWSLVCAGFCALHFKAWSMQAGREP